MIQGQHCVPAEQLGKDRERQEQARFQSQQWHADDQINGTERFENVAYPNLCLDVAGNPNNPDRGHLDAYPCTGQANQSWIFTPFDPDGAPTADQDIQDPPNG